MQATPAILGIRGSSTWANIPAASSYAKGVE